MSRFEFTDHAVVRYRERYRPDLAFDDARAELEQVSDGAERVEGRVGGGATLYQVANPPMRLVVKRDHDASVCVTVLPAAATFGDRLDGVTADEVLLSYQRATAHVSKGKRGADGEMDGSLTLAEQRQLRRQVANLGLIREEAEQARRAFKAERAGLNGRISKLEGEVARWKAKWAAPSPIAMQGKTRAQQHLARMEHEREAFRKIVRACMPFLNEGRGLPDVDEVLAAIEATDSSILDPKAWLPPGSDDVEPTSGRRG